MIASKYSITALCLFFLLFGAENRGKIDAKETEPGAHPLHVLLLSSYHKGHLQSDALASAIEAYLIKKHPGIQITFEYMDSKRFSMDDYHLALSQVYRHRYARIRFDVLIAFDDNALYFLRYHHGNLFYNSPIVFGGVENIEPELLINRHQITGIVELPDVMATIRLALRLHADIHQIYLIGDDRLHADIHQIYLIGDDREADIIRRQMDGLAEPNQHKLDVVPLVSHDHLDIEALLNSLREIPADSIVLAVSSWQGNFHNQQLMDSTLREQICRTSPVPVYAIDTQWLGAGAVGGKMFSAQSHGAVIGEMVLKILKGKAAADIPIQVVNTGAFTFDYRQLQRFAIDIEQLPFQSHVINRIVAWYENPQYLLWLWSASFLVLSVAITGFLITIQRRKQAQSALRKSENTLKRIFRAAPIGIGLTHNRELRWTNDQLTEITGYTASEMIGQSVRLLYPGEQEFKRVGEEKYRQIYLHGSGTVETKWIRKDGSLRDILLNSAPLIPDDIPQGVIYTALDITDRKATEATLRRQSTYMTALHETALGLVSRLDLEELLKSIVTKAVQLSDAQIGFIWIYDADTEELSVKVAAGKNSEEVLGDTLRPGEGIAGRVWQTGEPLMVEDYSQWEGRSLNPKYDSVHAALGVPVKTKSKLSGVIGLAQFDAKAQFPPDILQLMHHFAELVSIALDNARLYETLQKELFTRRRMQKRLRISEDRFRTLYRSTPAMLHSIDPTGCLREVSNYWLKSMGYSRDEVIGQKLTRFMTESSRQYAENEILPRFFKDGVVKDVHYRFVRKNGYIMDVLLSAIADTNDEGKMVRSLAILIDVTERFKIEKALAASQKELASILDNVPDVIFRLNESGHITYISDAITRYGYAADQLLGIHFLEIVLPKDKESVKKHMLNFERGGRQLRSLEVQLRSKSERSVPFEIFSILSEEHRTDRRGNMAAPLCLQGIARDITDRRKAQEEQLYREKLQAVLELAGAVCHELHQPMQSVTGYGELLLTSKSVDQAYEYKIKKLTEQIQRMAQITNKLQKISRYETKDYLKGKIIDIEKATEKSSA
jgi:PAS domain S-box-containing protein